MRRRNTFAFAFLAVLALLLGAAVLVPVATHAQATISTGSIQGTILDPNGAAVTNAKVTITLKETGRVITPEVTSSGDFNSGGLVPGTYVLRIEAPGFKVTEKTITVQVGVVSSGAATLEIGSGSTVVTVEATAVQLNTEQATVQGVMTTQQIEQLPIGGRNFLDLAQLEPGVQIQDGGNFDPTKNGFSSISFGGRFGRTARIEVDGIDISDETVGTTTQNIPASAIDEFQVSQSSLDLSTELTSSGSVNVVTRNGSNDFHGEGFFYGRDDGYAARIAPGDGPSVFTRHQYGANLGGPIIKNKLFFFGDFERTIQDLSAPVVMPGNFAALNGNFNSPFRDLELLGRVDWQISKNYRAFYRFNYEQNRNVKGFVPNTFNPFANLDNTPSHIGGLDFTTGSFTHSIRAGYMKFRNGITDAVAGSPIFNPGGNVGIAIGSDPFCLTAGADPFCSGPNFLAPQKTFQSNKQIKYDGSKALHSHILRYGIGVNRINGGGFAEFVGSGAIAASNGGLAATTPFPGGASNPLNYGLDTLTLGNGQGFSTEKPGFGLPGSGQQDTRFQWYIGDSWKIRSNLTLTYGLHYVRDTGRADSDLAPIPALNAFGPGLGNRVNQPNLNFSPNVGIAWDPFKTGKTVIRAGGGLYYENAVWNNVLFDRPVRLQQGLFLALAFPCSSTPAALALPDGTTVTTVNGHPIQQDCGAPIGNTLADAAALEALFQQATLTAGPQNNGSFIGNTLADGQNSTGNNLIAPSYRTPRSWQMNIGVQRELRPGTVLSVDYLRNIGVHFLLDYDTNHVGDARTLVKANAQAAISATLAACGAATINAAIAACPGLHPATMTTPVGPATIDDFAAHGLDSGNAVNSGFPCPMTIPGPGGCTAAAFPGFDPTVGQNQMLFPIGRSVYNGLDVKLTSNVTSPVHMIKRFNYQISYSFSRFVSQAQDQDFINNAADFANTGRFGGPNGLDRTHQLSAGAVMDLPFATRISFVTHWTSALPRTVNLPGGSIFTADLTGDGSFAGDTRGSQGDILPGSNIGSFGRDFGVSGLTNLINNFNNNIAGQTLTPAGQALVAAGLFTQQQLIALGATPQPIAAPPPGQVGLDQFFTFDIRLGWVIHPNKWIHAMPERVTIEPQIQFFNLFNRQNFDSPSQPLTGILDGSVGSLNGTTRSNQAGCDPVNNPAPCTARTNLTSLGSGVFALGAPRQMEWGIKVSF